MKKSKPHFLTIEFTHNRIVLTNRKSDLIAAASKLITTQATLCAFILNLKSDSKVLALVHSPIDCRTTNKQITNVLAYSEILIQYLDFEILTKMIKQP